MNAPSVEPATAIHIISELDRRAEAGAAGSRFVEMA
jgi:hypothetical protein